MKEQIVLLGKTKSLVGIMTEPNSDSKDNLLPAIIILNAGLLHRIGPNRIHVKIARRMAVAGYFVLRFDFSGIGDSNIRDDNLPFEKSSVSETQEAMQYLSLVKGIKKFILVGLCSGANVALKTAYIDTRVAGVIGINGSYFDGRKLDIFNQSIKANIQGRYYRKNLFNYKSWWRIITGKSNFSSILDFFICKAKSIISRKRNLTFESEPFIRCSSLMKRGADLFLIYSEGSLALDTFHLTLEHRLKELKESGNLRIEIVKHTDHVFTLLWSQDALMNLIYQWTQNSRRKWITV